MPIEPAPAKESTNNAVIMIEPKNITGIVPIEPEPEPEPEPSTGLEPRIALASTFPTNSQNPVLHHDVEMTTALPENTTIIYLSEGVTVPSTNPLPGVETLLSDTSQRFVSNQTLY